MFNIIENEGILEITLEEGISTSDISREDLENELSLNGYEVLITEEQVDELRNNNSLTIELNSNEEDTNEEPTETNKPFDNIITRKNGIVNVTNKVPLYNKLKSKKVHQCIERYLDMGYLIDQIVYRRQWCAIRVDFEYEGGQIYRDINYVCGEQITLLDMIAEDTYPNKTGMDGRNIHSCDIEKIDNNTVYLEILAEENITAKIFMSRKI